MQHGTVSVPHLSPLSAIVTPLLFLIPSTPSQSTTNVASFHGNRVYPPVSETEVSKVWPLPSDATTPSTIPQRMHFSYPLAILPLRFPSVVLIGLERGMTEQEKSCATRNATNANSLWITPNHWSARDKWRKNAERREREREM